MIRKRHTLTHFHPHETHWLDITKKPPVKNRWAAWWYVTISFKFWAWIYRLHITDWGYPRFLTSIDGRDEFPFKPE